MLLPHERLEIAERLTCIRSRQPAYSIDEAESLLDTVLECGWEWSGSNQAFVYPEFGLAIHIVRLARFTAASFRDRHERICANVRSHPRLAENYAMSHFIMKGGCFVLGLVLLADLAAGWSVFDGMTDWLMSLAGLYLVLWALYICGRWFMAPYQRLLAEQRIGLEGGVESTGTTRGSAQAGVG